MIQTLVVLLGAIAVAVPLSRRLGFGGIVGYLLAGAIIGPAGLRLVTNVDQIATVSQLGVAMLLFLIGLELRPHRLWVLRNAVFGLGLGQMVPSATILAVLAHLAGATWTGAMILGAGLALSSTAIVMPMLSERGLMASMAGRDSFAVLLFQDMAFIPMVALVPLLAGGAIATHAPAWAVGRGVLAIAAILIGGYVLVWPLFRAVGGAHTPEVFTATALLLVIGSAGLADWAGLSMSLGAFMAGVVLSDSEYRHELQADIQPFQGLLLGFFFISVGMAADLDLAIRSPGTMAAIVAVIIVVKAAVAFGVGWAKRKTLKSALRLALALPQGSEFGFVLFGSAVARGALGQPAADTATLAIAVSMVIAPMLFSLSERLVMPRFDTRKETAAGPIHAIPAPVIVCGFGRIGQIVGRILRMQGIGFTALDKSPAQIAVVRRFGGKVYFGNPTREDIMRAAGADQARILVVALDDADEALAVVDLAKRHFPRLRILARARNRHQAHLLMDRGVEGCVRETFAASLELGEMVLTGLGIAEADASRAVALFREHDEQTLIETQAIAHDEMQLIQSAQQAAEELAELFEADRAERRGAGRASLTG